MDCVLGATMRDINSIIKDLNSVKKFLEQLSNTQGRKVADIKERMILLQIEEVDFPAFNVFSDNKATDEAWSMVERNTTQRLNALDNELYKTVLHALKSNLSYSADFFGALAQRIFPN